MSLRTSGCADRGIIESLEPRRLLAVDFSIATITDTQYAVESFPADFATMTQWLADHHAEAAYNIKFVAHQGDLLRRGYSDFQAGNADAAMDLLNGQVPYAISMGNHDYDNQFDDLDRHISSANWGRWFGDARYQAIPGSGFGGASLDQRNRYSIFSAGGRQFMFLSIEFEAPDAAITWAQGVINAHRHLPIILSTHAYLNNGGRRTSVLDTGVGNSGAQIWDKLVKLNPQIFMVLSGHSGAIYSQASTNNAGSKVYEITADFEGRPNGGQGWMQLISFDMTAGTISLRNFSPVANQWETPSISVYSGINFAQRFSFAAAEVPIANNDTMDVAPGTPLTFDVRENDFDPDSNVAVVNVTPGTLPTGVVKNANNTFTYTPDGSFRGDVSFTYTINDGSNSSNAATVTLRVNAPPAGQSDVITAYESKAVPINVLSNDTDDNPADIAALTPILASLPPGGAVFASRDKSFDYTPDPKFTGVDTFSYYLSDGKTRSGPYTVTVNVTPLPPRVHYPVAENTVRGTRSGDADALLASDNRVESLLEVPQSGSDLEHRWQFNITAGSDLTFCINAWRSWGDDEFHFSYSTNQTTWTDLTRLVGVGSRDVTRTRFEIAEPYQMWGLPSALSGTVWVRATDTVNVTSSEPADTLYVDEVFIVSGVPLSPPTAAPAVTATPRGWAIELDWDAVPAACGYMVYRSTSAGGPFELLTPSPVDSSVFRDTSALADQRYWYGVAGSNIFGTGPQGGADDALNVPGDLTLDAVVDSDDYFVIDCGFQKQGSPGEGDRLVAWSLGDLNFDARVDIDDYFIIDGGYARGQPGLAMIVAGDVHPGAAAWPFSWVEEIEEMVGPDHVLA